MGDWSQEAQRVGAREYLFYGSTTPLGRVTHFLAVTQGEYEDGEGEEESSCQWEAMVQVMPMNRGARRESL